jgi:hypothetical protein
MSTARSPCGLTMLRECVLSCPQVRGKDAAFGGIQLVFCGDFFQLPPVCRDGGGAAPSSAFAFSAAAWVDAKFATVELREPFRQTDPAFFRVLNAVRMCVASCTHFAAGLRVC